MIIHILSFCNSSFDNNKVCGFGVDGAEFVTDFGVGDFLGVLRCDLDFGVCFGVCVVVG